MRLRITKIVLCFWLVGWFLKAGFFSFYIFEEVIVFPYQMNFFPRFFQSPLVLGFFYLLPLLCVTGLYRDNAFYLRFSGWIMLIASCVLLLHQDTHNDATFLTSFWVAVWFLWLVYQEMSTNKVMLLHAKSLALCVIAFIFAGAFIGKLTPEYWSGQAFADIFMQQDYGWIGQWIRAHFPEDNIRTGFWWLSKAIIVGEGIMATAPLWPYSFILWFGIALMVSISFFTTWLIFSVLACLIGLLYAVGHMEWKN
ncbi:MAG: hypothetical protein JNN05_11475 [Candidatus Omnitrophica bacterium]|nr:hypothetical protein [Candidatus Omnitrophota bacterium]